MRSSEDLNTVVEILMHYKWTTKAYGFKRKVFCSVSVYGACRSCDLEWVLQALPVIQEIKSSLQDIVACVELGKKKGNKTINGLSMTNLLVAECEGQWFTSVKIYIF